MFDIRVNEDGRIILSGRFDATQVQKANDVFKSIDHSAVVDFTDLEYISSAGLGVFLSTLRRLSETGNNLKLVNMNKHVRDIFRYSGLDKLFEVE